MWSYTVASLAKRTAAPTRFRLCSVDRISQFIGGSLSFNTYVVYRRDILLNMLAMNAVALHTKYAYAIRHALHRQKGCICIRAHHL